MEMEKSLNSLADTNGKTDSGEGDGDVNMDCDSSQKLIFLLHQKEVENYKTII